MGDLLGGCRERIYRTRLHAPQRGLYTVNNARRQQFGPLVDGLIAHADSLGCRRNGAAKLFNCCCFLHA